MQSMALRMKHGTAGYGKGIPYTGHNVVQSRKKNA